MRRAARAPSAQLSATRTIRSGLPLIGDHSLPARRLLYALGLRAFLLGLTLSAWPSPGALQAQELEWAVRAGGPSNANASGIATDGTGNS
jgi:hypothetical protein